MPKHRIYQGIIDPDPDAEAAYRIRIGTGVDINFGNIVKAEPLDEWLADNGAMLVQLLEMRMLDSVVRRDLNGRACHLLIDLEPES